MTRALVLSLDSPNTLDEFLPILLLPVAPCLIVLNILDVLFGECCG